MFQANVENTRGSGLVGEQEAPCAGSGGGVPGVDVEGEVWNGQGFYLGSMGTSGSGDSEKS